MKLLGIIALACAAQFAAVTANAASITLKLIDSYSRGSAFNGPFGLAFDGTHIYYSMNNRSIHQMTTSGVDTGVVFNGPVWSELAWDGSQLLSANGTTVYKFDVGGGNLTTHSITAPGYTGISLNDGLDWDNGELWSSPDVGNVYRLSGDLTTHVGAAPFLGGGGGYSGVERIQGAGQDYVVVVNDAKSPRELCVHQLDGSLLGCQQFQNSRYEGLAFDGRYLFAADYFGGRIDKYDILSDGGSIIVPGVPLPASLPLLAGGIGLIGLVRRRRAKRA